MAENTDRIEKRGMLRAPRDRVWRAICDSKQFGSWFGVAFDAPFTPGAHMKGRIVGTTVDAEVAKMQKPHEGAPFECSIDRIEPMRLFSFRWHPYAVDPGVDYAAEPSTLVVFELEEVAGGTMLTITESGFDSIPLDRRAKAFSANQRGWEAQTTLIQKYVAMAA